MTCAVYPCLPIVEEGEDRGDTGAGVVREVETHLGSSSSSFSQRWFTGLTHHLILALLTLQPGSKEPGTGSCQHGSVGPQPITRAVVTAADPHINKPEQKRDHKLLYLAHRFRLNALNAMQRCISNECINEPQQKPFSFFTLPLLQYHKNN